MGPGHDPIVRPTVPARVGPKGPIPDPVDRRRSTASVSGVTLGRCECCSTAPRRTTGRRSRSAAGARRTGSTTSSVASSPRTAGLATGYDAVCVFVNDDVERTRARAAPRRRRRLPSPCAAPGSTTSTSMPRRRLGVAVVTGAGLLAGGRRRAHPRADPRSGPPPPPRPPAVREGNFALDGLLGRGLHGAHGRRRRHRTHRRSVARLLLAFGCAGPRPRPGPATRSWSPSASRTSTSTSCFGAVRHRHPELPADDRDVPPRRRRRRWPR